MQPLRSSKSNTRNRKRRWSNVEPPINYVPPALEKERRAWSPFWPVKGVSVWTTWLVRSTLLQCCIPPKFQTPTTPPLSILPGSAATRDPKLPYIVLCVPSRLSRSINCRCDGGAVRRMRFARLVLILQASLFQPVSGPISARSSFTIACLTAI